MQVQFEFTREDLVDAYLRLFERGNLRESEILKTSLYSAFATAAIVFIFLQDNFMIGLLGAFITACLIVLLYPRLQRSSLEAKVRKIADEMMAGEGPYVCEVELRPEGVWLRQMNRQIIYEWKSLKAIVEASDSVDVFSHDGSGVVVRNRAFSSEAERSRFIELIRSNLNPSRERKKD